MGIVFWILKSSAPHFLTFIASSDVLGLGIDNEYSVIRGRDGSVGNDRLRAGRLVVRFPAGERCFSLLHSVQTGSGAHPAFYTKGTVGFFPRDKATEAWS
jgi:hypothetical protein